MFVRIWCALALVWLAVPLSAHAAPTPAQLERAKQAFADGKKLHDAGKLVAAVEKFKLSYELSGNPLLLYNIGLTMEELGSDDLAVVYFRRFLAEAPPDAAQRQDATERIAAITRKLMPPASPEPPGPGQIPDARIPPTPTAPPTPPPAEPSPAPTAEPLLDGAAGFQHRPVEAAPPGRPLDLTAVVPEGSGLAVTLYFRTAGQATFTSTPMVWHHQELVGRIPAARMTGSALQYYLEVRGPTGALVARSGKSTVPNVVTLDAAAAPQSYPDVAEPVLTQVVGGRDAEDPLAPAAPVVRDGMMDVGSRSFGYAKWTTTALAGASVGAGVALYFLARDHGRALHDDATGCGAPPCQKFDSFDRDIERTGQREQTISNVALIGGAGIAAVAGYFWYRELTAGGRGDGAAAARARRDRATAWRVVPQLGRGGDGVTGAAAQVRF
jgi:hypothetical protein